MNYSQILTEKQSLFIDYILSFKRIGKVNLPSIKKIGEDLGFSTPMVREQIELAKNLGLIEVKPKIGITMREYDFSPAVIKSVYFAVLSDAENFALYSDLRNQLEKVYFLQAISLLTKEDLDDLRRIVENAKAKLDRVPPQIPHKEHRLYHMRMYKKINNVFLNGLLTAYWDLYEVVGLDLYSDLTYLAEVWSFHQGIIEKIAEKKTDDAFMLLEEHMELLEQRKK